ncbi:MAG: PAS domain S-box protein [Betaproteobacteria bacterium]|nr:PAS domain S-box protein [Betaproteobacteria bacterium]
MEVQARIARELPSGADPTDAQFRLLVESVTDYAIFLLDSEGRVTSWNAGAERIKGYGAAEILGRHISVFYPTEERTAGAPQRLLDAAAREGRVSAQGWRLRKDASRFWADVVITALRDGEGELTGFAKVTRDMTRARLAEERLRDSEARLIAFTEHSPAAMYLKDVAGNYRFANRQFLSRHGLRREQVLGRRDEDIFPGSQVPSPAASDAEVMARRATCEFEQTMRTAEGERVHMIVKFPVFDATGGVVGVGGVSTDITQRKATEQQLLEQRTLLSESQTLAGVGSWEWEPGTGRLAWSEEMFGIYGLSRRDFAPNFDAYLARVHPEDRQMSATVLARALAEGRSFVHEERVLRPDGSERTVRTHGEIVRDAHGRALKLVAACLDVTEQRHAEQALRAAAEELQSLTRRLVQVEEAERRRIAGELHDRVGQNLSALNINLEIALGALGDAPLPEARARLHDALSLVELTLQTLENVMADLRPPLLEEYGLGAALGWYVQEFARRAGLEVKLEDLAREHTRRLPRDAAVALFRIAQEALTNVAKHAGANRALLRLEAAERGVSLTVRDDGRGFNPASPSRPGRLGMTTMKERATAAGGSLALESVPDKGTTLTAHVPF